MNDALRMRTICSAETITMPNGGDVYLVPAVPVAELSPALSQAHSPLDLLDLLDSREGYDLTQRLGDTGAASPFVGNPFGVDLAPAFSSSDTPSAPMQRLFEAEWQAGQHRPPPAAPAQEESLAEFLAGLSPNKNWWDDL